MCYGICRYTQMWADVGDLMLTILNTWSLSVFYFSCFVSTVRRWNLHNGYCLNEIRGHEAFVYRYVGMSVGVV